MNDERFTDPDGLPPVPPEAPPQPLPSADEGESIAWTADSETHLPEIEHRAHMPAYEVVSGPLPVCDLDTPDGEPCEEPAVVKRWSSAAVITAASLGAVFGALAVAALLVWVFGVWPGSRPLVSLGNTAANTPAATPASYTINSSSNVDAAVAVAAKVNPSVVSIKVEQKGFNPFTGTTGYAQTATGSGVIIRSEGYVLTNYHVIEGGDRITVTVGAEDLEAKIVGADAQTDLAVLKIDGGPYPAIEIGNSSDLKVGQFVVAVGSPFGLEKTVTSGIISALQRDSLAGNGVNVTAYTNLIQTDAAINPGNSGGALVDEQGRLIGINTLIQSTSGASAGIGFAIPSDFAIDVANQIISTGTVVHPYFGASTSTIDEATALQFGLRVSRGAFVQFVESGSPAAAGGLERGDIIIKIDGTDIKGTEDVIAAVRAHKVGDTVSVVVVRNDAERTFKVTLGSDSRAN